MATVRPSLARAVSWVPGAQRTSPDTAVGLWSVAGLALAYFLTARVGEMFTSYSSFVSPLWPPAGVAVAGLLLLGGEAWPAITVGGFLLKVTNGDVNAATPGILCAQTLAPLAAASLLRRRGLDATLRRVRDVLALVVLGAAGSMLLSSTLGTASLVLTGIVPEHAAFRSWLVWWTGDAMGVVLVTPALLMLATRESRTKALVDERRTERAALLLSTALATYLLFRVDLPLPFLVFPFALWAALRLHQAAVATVNLLIGALAVWLTVKGHGPFSGLEPTTGLVVLDAFNGSIAVTSLILGAAVATASTLNHENDQLHVRVQSQLEEVRASRARLVQAADEERRRVERDLHDGAQRRLVSLSCTLGLARAQLESGSDSQLAATLEQATREMTLTLAELRQLARGIHPTILTQQGLGPAVESLAEELPLPVEVSVAPQRFPAVIEATSYFVVSEVLVNTVKHARATAASVAVEQIGGWLILEVVDNGIGGAAPEAGSGLSGLADRVSALEGRVQIDSRPGIGTRVRVELPCAST
jgi:signal transduction histidine kinase